MTFHYRVMQHRNKLSAKFVANMRKKHPDYKDYSEYVDIREVYYRDDAPRNEEIGCPDPQYIEAWTGEPSAPIAVPEDDNGPITGLAEEIKYYMLAMSLPILNEWELPGYKEPENV